MAPAIEALRQQLLEAQTAGQGAALSFGVGKVEVEFTVEAKTTGGGGAGVRFGRSARTPRSTAPRARATR